MLCEKSKLVYHAIIKQDFEVYKLKTMDKDRTLDLNASQKTKFIFKMADHEVRKKLEISIPDF